MGDFLHKFTSQRSFYKKKIHQHSADVNFPPWASSLLMCTMRRVSRVPDQWNKNRRWSEGAGTAGGGSRWAVEPGHRVGHRGIQAEEIRGQSSQQRMEERSGAELWEFVIAKCLQRETRGPPVHGWQRDDANMEKYHHTHGLRARSSKRGSLISVWGYIFFSTCASTFIRVWNQHPPSAGKNSICWINYWSSSAAAIMVKSEYLIFHTVYGFFISNILLFTLQMYCSVCSWSKEVNSALAVIQTEKCSDLPGVWAFMYLTGKRSILLDVWHFAGRLCVDLIHVCLKAALV